ncbi:uncharacterized protein ARMOST_03041 [Armillaria ostoyae]|uniref:Uncharacterized protein n=1 Tax=Armillaria ostoyae TaxID=47428 RepID=A0A284QTC7_ARMOS|nr:uncharacterized protein ARMOST_03041 [Armillaria ostoyae]
MNCSYGNGDDDDGDHSESGLGNGGSSDGGVCWRNPTMVELIPADPLNLITSPTDPNRSLDPHVVNDDIASRDGKNTYPLEAGYE